MTEPPNLSTIVQSWVQKAEHDFGTANLILKSKDDELADMACYHAQQCAEKYIKVLFIKKGLDVPRIHDLLELAKKLPPKDQAKFSLDALSDLNSFAVDVRYPGDWNTPLGLAEAAKAMRIADEVRTIVQKELKA